ncbi:hypothetical protein [Streptomyces prasinopilosus]|uniref:hypothetical protein n=1 Tax=Streptomyces prasinopilosus TaxID=67344 RepID=UPI0006E2C9D0|nr:hypothetical protein [Streptomyces prasinopilosus]
MGTTALTVFASTLIAAPAAQAADVTLTSRTSTQEKDGRIHAVYESYDDHVRPEDVSIRIRKKGSDRVLDTVRIADRCAPESDCWDMKFLSEPVTLPEMGVYTTDVVVGEGRPDELVDRDNGELDYGLAPRLTVTSDRQWISYDNHLITVSGTLVAEDPNTREVKPFAGAGLYHRTSAPYGGDGWLRTDDEGRFTDTLHFSGEDTDVQHHYSFGAERETITLPFRKQELKLKVDAPLGVVNAPYGSEVPVRGKLIRVADDGTEKPMAGYGLTIGGKGVLPTRKDGSFSARYTVKQGGTVRIEPGEWGWFHPTAHSLEVAEPPRTSTFTSLKAGVDKYRKVTFTGRLGVSKGSYPAGASAVVAIEHSTDGKTWSSAGTFTAKYGATFTESPAEKGSTGSHWRLRHTGASLNSASFKLGRKYTELVDDDMTPEGVRKGRTLTARGSLVQKSGSSWKAFPGQTVRVYFKASTKGATWKKLGTAKTLSNGTFSKKFTARQDGTWQIRYVDTPSTHYADHGREDYIDVR